MFQQGGYNIRMKVTHFLKAAPFTSALISMVKIALKRTLAARVSASYTLKPLHTAMVSASYKLYKLHTAIIRRQGKCKLYKAQGAHRNKLQTG